jgi:DNA-binding NarL/FixJ family response regulator
MMNAADVQPVPIRPQFLQDREWSAIVASLRLCKRETEVVSGIIAGESEARLAERLGISTHTVHTYIDRLYRRLAVRSRCELVVRIFEVYVTATRPGVI